MREKENRENNVKKVFHDFPIITISFSLHKDVIRRKMLNKNYYLLQKKKREKEMALGLPNFFAVFITLQAISPLLAIRSFSIGFTVLIRLHR